MYPIVQSPSASVTNASHLPNGTLRTIGTALVEDESRGASVLGPQSWRVDRLCNLNVGVYKIKLSVNSVLSELIASGSGHLLAVLCPQLNIGPFAGPLTIRRVKDATLRTGDAPNRSAMEGSAQTILKRMSSAVLTRSDLNVLTAGRSYFPTFKLSVLDVVGTQILQAQESPFGCELVRFRLASLPSKGIAKEYQDVEVDAQKCSGNVQGGHRESVSDHCLSP